MPRPGRRVEEHHGPRGAPAGPLRIGQSGGLATVSTCLPSKLLPRPDAVVGQGIDRRTVSVW